MTEHKYKLIDDDQQFLSSLRAMVVVSTILFKAGYFLGLKKCHLIPEKVMTYLGIEYDSLKGSFTVPEVRVTKNFPFLEGLKGKNAISFSYMEQ